MISDSFSPIRSRRLSNYIKHLSGLIAYYPLDEVSGSTAYNKAPTTQGTFNGTITGATVGQAGKVGKAFSFDGSGDYVAASPTVITFSQSFSIVCLVNPTTLDGNAATQYCITGKETNADNKQFRLNFLGDGKVTVALYDAGGVGATRTTTSAIVSANTWYLLTLIFNWGSNTLSVYNNTTSLTFDSNSISGKDGRGAPSEYSIGAARAGTNAPFIGLIQHVAVFQSVLTTENITKISRIGGFI